ncbi:MAG: GDP-L-fucose synthase [Gemmatimonadota bacterium]
MLGARGMVGSALVRSLRQRGYDVVEHAGRTLGCDLRNPDAAEAVLRGAQPAAVFLAAARVGGIGANSSRQWDFLRDNLLIALNCIDAAVRLGAHRFVFLGSSCIYPREAPQPLREEYLLGGPLEPTNRGYAVAKIAGVELCRAWHDQHPGEAPRFVCPMPTNLYGPGDNFDLEGSHLVPALVRKLVEARDAGAPEVTLWGTGTPRREVLHVDDCADAVVMLAEHDDPPLVVNVGCGEDLPVSALAERARQAVGYGGRVRWDDSRPDGMPRKLLDVRWLRAMGWRPRIGLDEGLRATVEWYEAHREEARL